MESARSLDALQVGQLIPFGGDRVTFVTPELAGAFEPGDRLVVVQDSGALLHIPAREHRLVRADVQGALDAFHQLARTTDDEISEFYEMFARRLADDEIFAAIAAANDLDVAAASSRGRSTTRLILSPSMRADMIAGLRVWRDAPGARNEITEVVEHDTWTVTARRAPLGVVGFVFEGRPNVFADAAGVLRTGNTAVLRIGSDALGTARAIVERALRPALAQAGLPAAAVTLVDSPSRATAWALFDDRRLSLAVARGSGEAVAQLGAVARQAGVPVSLHGTGGAWLIASSSAEIARFASSVIHSLDRKVCNTLNVCCIVADRADDLVPALIEAVRAAGAARGTTARLHVETASAKHVPPHLFTETVAVVRAEGVFAEPFASEISLDQIGTEWEWEGSPEVSLIVVASVEEAIALFNRFSARLTASLISTDQDEQRAFYDTCDAPFIGNGLTRWVDGQFALNRPELGLSNWEGGRLFARSAVLSGDSVFTVRLTATIGDAGLRR